MLLVDDLAAGGTKNLRHTPRGLVTLILYVMISIIQVRDFGPLGPKVVFMLPVAYCFGPCVHLCV